MTVNELKQMLDTLPPDAELVSGVGLRPLRIKLDLGVWWPEQFMWWKDQPSYLSDGKPAVMVNVK